MRGQLIEKSRVGRVVVRGANWVGDAVMTVPALRELRRLLPGAHVTLATRAWAEGVFAGADYIDDLLVVEGARGVRARLREIRRWREGRFDLALLLPNAFEPALVARAAGVPLRLGYATDGRGVLLTHPLPVPEWRGQKHEVFYYLNLVTALERLLGGAAAAGAGGGTAPRLDLTDDRRREALDMLRGRGVRAGAAPVVALCPGSTNSRAKRWPAERFAALADLLVEEAGADVIFIGSKEERDVTDEVVGRMRRRPAAVLTGETPLAEGVAVLGAVDLLVTNDTGPAHVAAAVGTPVVVIFGPTDPATTRPFSELAEVVRRPPACAPCMLRDCPTGHECMTAVAPAEVFERAARFIGRRRQVVIPA